MSVQTNLTPTGLSVTNVSEQFTLTGSGFSYNHISTSWNNLLTTVQALVTVTTSINEEITRATSAEANRELIENKSLNVSTDATSDIKYPSVKAIKTYVDSGFATTTSLATREVIENKSLNVSTDATSDIKYPSVKAIKTYVDSSFAKLSASNIFTGGANTFNGIVSDSLQSSTLIGTQNIMTTKTAGQINIGATGVINNLQGTTTANLSSGSSAVTQTAGTNNTTIATTEFVQGLKGTANTWSLLQTFTTGILASSINSLTSTTEMNIASNMSTGISLSIGNGSSNIKLNGNVTLNRPIIPAYTYPITDISKIGYTSTIAITWSGSFNTIIATSPILPIGTYFVNVSFELSGTFTYGFIYTSTSASGGALPINNNSIPFGAAGDRTCVKGSYFLNITTAGTFNLTNYIANSLTLLYPKSGSTSIGGLYITRLS